MARLPWNEGHSTGERFENDLIASASSARQTALVFHKMWLSADSQSRYLPQISQYLRILFHRRHQSSRPRFFFKYLAPFKNFQWTFATYWKSKDRFEAKTTNNLYVSAFHWLHYNFALRYKQKLVSTRFSPGREWLMRQCSVGRVACFPKSGGMRVPRKNIHCDFQECAEITFSILKGNFWESLRRLLTSCSKPLTKDISSLPRSFLLGVL